jgi:hypothetical protein
MIFRFPKKKIVLDCFTHYEHILKTAPVTEAIKHVPDWWRKLPTHYMNKGFIPSSTVKNCAGIRDYYNRSVAIPLWCDLAIAVKPNGEYSWQFSDNRTKVIVHDKRQIIGFFDTHGHMKIEAPWSFRTNKNVHWVWSCPTYSIEEANSDIKIPPGVIDFYHQTDVNINLFVPLTQIKTYLINAGQVMVHLTPMFDNDIEIKRHLVSEQEFQKTIDLGFATTFFNRRRNYLNQKEKFLDCPYHKE